MKAKRLVFAKQHADWTVRRWKLVLFSDESSFEITAAKNRISRVGRARSSPHEPQRTVLAVKPWRVMAWGCFSAIGRGYLNFLADSEKMDVSQYLEILRSRAQPVMAKLGAKRIFQDGAPCHRAKNV